MKFEIIANRLYNRNNPKKQYSVLVRLDDATYAINESFQKLYKGTLYGASAETSLDSFLLDLAQKGVESKVLVADESTRIIGCEAAPGNSLRETLERLEKRYFIAPRNEWVSCPELFDFYSLNEDTGYTPGTPVERLRQAAFDTRRTGTAFLNLGFLKNYQPDLAFMFESLSEAESDELEHRLNCLSLEIREFESNDGIIKPKLTIKEADKVAELFEQMADIVEPYWKRVEEEYDRGNEK